MREYLKSIAGQLKQFSESLDKKSILIDQPWALIDDELEMQKLIFKKDGKLIMSKNGNVTIGSWEYLGAANSLLIDRGEDKILCNEEFVNHAVMILRMDGTNNHFIALANENYIPNLNVEDYLNNKLSLLEKSRNQNSKKLNDKNQNLKKFELKDGTTIYIDLKKSTLNYRKGDVVYKDPQGKMKLDDGYYKISFMEGIKVKNGRII